MNFSSATKRSRVSCIRLELEFDGAAYFGWQYQPNRPTVQGQVESALQKLFGSKVGVIGAGRTDTGVSALSYTVSFRPPRDIEPHIIQSALNRFLNRDIRIVRARVAPARFHARFDALSRRYRYTTVTGRSPLLRSRAWEIDYPLDIEPMALAAKLFLGRHDLAPFCRLASQTKSLQDSNCKVQNAKFAVCSLQFAVCSESTPSAVSGLVNVLRARVARRRCSITGLHLIQLEFEADHFLYKMVRRMVGALVDIGRGLYSHDDLAQAISDRPLVQFSTAPAHGLLFVQARYSPLSITSASSRSG